MFFHRSHHHDGRPGILSARWSSWGLQWGEECGCGGLSHHPQRVLSKLIPACQLESELNEPLRIIWFMKYLQECSAQDVHSYIPNLRHFWVILNMVSHNKKPLEYEVLHRESCPNNWSTGYLPLTMVTQGLELELDSSQVDVQSQTEGSSGCFLHVFPWTGTLDHLCGFLHSLRPHGYNTSGKVLRLQSRRDLLERQRTVDFIICPWKQSFKSPLHRVWSLCCEIDRGLPLGFVLVGLHGQCILECPPLLVSLVNLLPFASGQGVKKSEK